MQKQSLVINNQNQSGANMTSLEMAEITGKRHDSVKRTIETLADKCVIEFPQIVEIKTATKPTSGFVFSGAQGKRDSIIVVAQLSPEFTAQLVDRWQELEQQTAKPSVPTSFAEALRLAADQAEQIQQLQITHQHNTMKIDVLEQLLAAGVSAPEFCRRLNGVNTMRVNEFLLDAGWLILATGSKVRWRVASYARDKYMTEKAFEVTPKAGAKRLVALYMASKLPMKKTWNNELRHDLDCSVGSI